MTRHRTAPGTLPTSTIAAARSVRIPAGEHQDAVAKKKEARPGYQREADNHSTKPAIRTNAPHNTARRFALLTFALQRVATPTSRLDFLHDNY